MKYYYANVPGCAHAIECYGYNEMDARKRLRNKLCIERLPKGTKLYEKC